MEISILNIAILNDDGKHDSNSIAQLEAIKKESNLV